MTQTGKIEANSLISILTDLYKQKDSSKVNDETFKTAFDEAKENNGTVSVDILLQQIESVVDREIFSTPCHIQGIEASLGIAQSQVEGTGLQYLVGVPRRETQAATAIDDVFAQSYGQIDHSVFGFLVVDGIIVDRPPYPGK